MVEGLEEECELEEEEGRPLERQVTFELSGQLEQLMVSGTRDHSKVAFLQVLQLVQLMSLRNLSIC